MHALLPKRMGAAAQVAAVLFLAAAPVLSTAADARAGGGFSFGSRGSRSYSMPATTATAPRSSQPFQDSEAPRFRPGMTTAGQPRRFGFGSGLLAGLFGAGLLGMFTGAGFFGAIFGLFGLLFKLALIGGVIWLLLRLFRGRVQPAMAGNTAQYRGPAPSGGATSGSGFVRNDPIVIQADDYQAFEQALGAIQDAYSREDLQGLSRLATPEMVRHFASDVEANRQRGVRNDVSQVKLLQGDLSESWSEGNVSYATLAMRFSGIDVMLDRNTRRIASGDPLRPVEAVELWTFRREGRGPWILSGIQQAR